jgi:hypothetical protein
MQTRVLNELRRVNRKLDFIINRLDKIEKEGLTEMAWIEICGLSSQTTRRCLRAPSWQ